MSPPVILSIILLARKCQSRYRRHRQVGDWIPFRLDPELMVSRWRIWLEPLYLRQWTPLLSALRPGKRLHPQEVLRRLCDGRLPQVVSCRARNQCEDGPSRASWKCVSALILAVTSPLLPAWLDKVKTKRILSSAVCRSVPLLPINVGNGDRTEDCAKSL